MGVIYKYPLALIDNQSIKLPVNSKILYVKLQNDIPHIWVLQDKDPEFMSSNDFYMYFTGHDIKEQNTAYVGSFQIGIHIYHLFHK